MKVTKVLPNTVMYKLKAENDDKDKYLCQWADFTLEFDFRRLSIHSDLGDYAYCWGHSDYDSLMNLLSRVSKDYLLDKLSSRTVFDVVESKKELVKYVRQNAEYYNIFDTNDIIEKINDIEESVSEEMYLYKVRDIIEWIEFVDIPVEKRYPYNAETICDFFIKYIQPQIKAEFEASKKS